MQSRTCRSGPPTANLLSTFRFFDPGDYKQRARSLDAFQIPARQNTNSYRLQQLLDVDLFGYQLPSQSLQSEELRLRSVSTTGEVGEPPPEPPDPVVSLRDPEVEMPGCPDVPIPTSTLDAVAGYKFIAEEREDALVYWSVSAACDEIQEIVGASPPPAFARKMAQKEFEVNPEHTTIRDLENKMENRFFEIHNQDDSNVPNEEHSLELDDWSDEKLVELIQKATNCDVVGCEDKICKKAKHLVQELDSSLRYNHSYSPKPLPSSHQKVLRTLARHAIVCDSVGCRVPWCMIMQALMNSNGEQEIDDHQLEIYLVAKLHRLYISHELQKAEDLPHDESSETFIQIDNNIEWPSRCHEMIPCCGLDYDVLEFDITGRFRRIVSRATSLTSPSPFPVVILQYETQDWTASTWSKLKDVVVDVYWVKFDERHVTVCSRLEVLSADSLANEMRRCNGSLPPVRMWSYLLDLANVMNQLHTAGILCLNFDASRIQLCKNLTVAKLADFSSAVDESFLFDDVTVETILQLLSPEVPPEMFDGDIGKHSDIWLFGCLFYHMATGVRLYHEDRHLSHDEMRKMVRRKDRPPNLCGIQGCEILERTLVEKSERIQLPELMYLLEEQLIEAVAATMEADGQ